MTRVGIGPDYLPNRELGLLCGRLTLGHSLVGHEVGPVQGSQHFAFLHSGVFAVSPALSRLLLSFLFLPEVGQLQTQVYRVHCQLAFGLLGLLPRRLSDGKRKGRLSCGL